MYQNKQQNQYNQYGQQSYFGKNVEIISRGKGINENEYQAITSACIEVKEKGRIPLSGLCIKKIQASSSNILSSIYRFLIIIFRKYSS